MNIEKMLMDFKVRGISIWREGEKLKFSAPKNSMNNEDIEWLKNHKNDILSYLNNKEDLYYVDRKNRYERFELTDIQSSYVMGRNDYFELGGIGCHGYIEIEYDNVLDVEKINRAWNLVIQKHDMLRAVIFEDGFQIVQRNVPDVMVESVNVDSNEESEFRDKLKFKQYKLGQWPMCELAVTIKPNKSIIHFSLDMLIADYNSINIVLNDLEEFYKNPEVEINSPRKYRDILNYQKKFKNSSKYKNQDEEYWDEKLDYIWEAPNLPTETQNNNIKTFNQKSIQLNKDEWEKICTVARSNNITSSVLIMSALSETIAYWSTNKKFSINTTFFNRPQIVDDINFVVGDFTDVNITSINMDYNKTFMERAKSLQNTLWSDLEHNSVSGVDILRKISQKRKQNMIIPVVFTSTVGLSDNQTILSNRKILYKISQTPQVYLDCQIMEENDGVKINWDIRNGVFKECVISDMFECFTSIINRLKSNEEEIINSKIVTQLSGKCLEKRETINNTFEKFEIKRLEDCYFDALKEHKNKTALICDSKEYTYEEFNKYVYTVFKILGENGLSKGDRVIVDIPKNIWQIASVIAILAHGGVYVPVNASQPIERKKKIVRNSNAKVILTFEDEVIDHDKVKNINLKDSRILQNSDNEYMNRIEKSCDEEAYIIFTSGTTGEPKGVVITHAAAMNTIIDVNNKYKINENDVFLGMANLSFDLSVYDIFGAFLIGGTLVLPDSDMLKDPKTIYNLMLLYRVSVWNSVPAQMQLIINYLEMSKEIKISEFLRVIMLSGDWIPIDLPKRIYEVFPDVKLISMGGATEASIWSIYHEIEKDEVFSKSVPYGTPLSNQKFYILDDTMTHCPDYVVGNLYISGTGLSLGYLNDEKLNKEKYKVLENAEERIYRTGDVGYYLPNGDIIFCGRENGDSQVKIHGHRIELSEIKSILLENTNIESAEVFVNEVDRFEKKICAVVSPKKIIVDKNIENIEATIEIEKLSELENDVNKEIDGELLKKWVKASEKVVLSDILLTFQKYGFFVDVSKKHSFEEIVNKIGIPEKLQKLTKRWLNVLQKEEIILNKDNFYLLANKDMYLNSIVSWDEFYKVEEKFGYGKDFVDYLKISSDNLPKLLTGEEDPLNLLFPKGDIKPAMASYHTNKINKICNNFIAQEIEFIVKNNKDRNRKIKILEIGAGVGGTTLEIIPKLKDEQIEYHFTDISTFFLNKAKDNFKEYDCIKYELFDINQAFYEQNYGISSFDIILCANVLHNSKNIDFVMNNIKNLLSSNGTLIVLDETKMSYMLLTSMEFKDGLTGFSDVRSVNEQTFFDRNQWSDNFKNHNGQIIYEFPNKNSILDVLGQTVYVVRFKDSYIPLTESNIKKKLKEMLVSYMVPNEIKILPQFPTTANGKIDKKILKLLFKDDISMVSDEKEEIKTPIEEKIEKIWMRELGLIKLRLDDNFYSVGGDSLLIAQIVTKVIEEVPEAKIWEWSALLSEMMQFQTVREISKRIQDKFDNKDESKDLSLLSIKESNVDNNQSIAKVIFHAGTGTLSAYTEIINYIKEDSKENEAVLGFTFGSEAEYISMKTEDTFKMLGEKYGKILKELNFSKYILIGHCVGGLIALETAEFLKNHNEEVVDVTLISTTIPKDQERTSFNAILPSKYKKALYSNLKNEILLERTFARLINADIFNAGHSITEPELNECINHMVIEGDGDLNVDSFLKLSGKYKYIAEQFNKLKGIPISERLNNLYLTINRESLNLQESEIRMLNTLFNIFSQNFGCISTYLPKEYDGRVRLFYCEEQENSFYGEFFAEDRLTWEKYLKGEAYFEEIQGQHFNCLNGENLKNNLEKILDFKVN